jgi:dihydrofolate reductase
MNYNIIVASDKNFGIGKTGDLPWSIKEDLEYFKKITNNSIVIMGRKTWDSIFQKLQKPLPNRFNIVISNSTKKDLNFSNLEFVSSQQEAIKQCNKLLHKNQTRIYNQEIFIIGGLAIYEMFLSICTNLYWTIIDKVYDCDIYFRHLSELNKLLIFEEKIQTSNHIDLTFNKYKLLIESKST